MKKRIELSNNIYNLNAIKKSIEYFKQFVTINIIDDSYTLEFDFENSLEYDSNSIVDEFNNYLVFKSKEDLINTSKGYEVNDKTDNVIKEIESDFRINFYRYTKIDDKYLVITDKGNHVFLDEKEFLQLKNIKIDSLELKKKLIDNNIILNKFNIKSEINSLFKKKSFLFSGVSLHIIVLTLRCNMNCIYCQVNAENKNEKFLDLNIENAKKIVDIIFQSPSNMLSIEFQGGEPLLNFDVLKYIVEYANNKNKIHNKKLIFSIVSNLLLLDEEKFKFLVKNQVSICTSLDGNKMIHNANRGFFDQTVKKIKYIQQEYKKLNYTSKLNCITVVTRTTLPYYKEIIDEFVDLGFSTIFLKQLTCLGKAEKNNEKINYSADEFLNFWEKSLNYAIELSLKGVDISLLKANIILKKIFYEYDSGFVDMQSPCGAATSQLVYDYNGKIYTCDEARMLNDDMFCLGDLNKEDDISYKKITTCNKSCSVRAFSITDTMFCDKCVYKPYCGICPVLNYSMYKNLVVNIPATDWCKINKGIFNIIFKKLKDEKSRKVLVEWFNKDTKIPTIK